MNLKTLFLTLISLFLIGCNSSTPSPNVNSEQKSFRQQSSTPSSSSAILQLDTKGHTALIRDIIVTKSGDIISASDDKTIRVWSSKTGKEKRKILGQIGAGSGEIFAIALSPNEEFLAVGGFMANFNGSNHKDIGRIRIYNYKSGRLISVLKSHSNVVHDLAFSQDGKYLISGSADDTAKIWSVGDWNLIDTIKSHTNNVYAVKIIKKQGSYFAITAGYDNQISLYNMQKKKSVKSHHLPYKLMDLATSKNHIAVCGTEAKIIQIYDYNLNPIKTIKSETKPKGLAYSPNGDFLIAGTGTSPRNVNIYSVKNHYQKIQSFKKHKNLTRAVAFLDNQTAVSGGGNNNEIYIWSIKSGRVLKKIEGVGEVVWSVGIRGETIGWGNDWLGGDTHTTGTKLQKTINLKSFKILNHASNLKKIATQNGRYSLIHKKGGDYGYADAILEIQKDGKKYKSIIRGSTNGLSHRCYGFYRDYIVSGGSNGFLKIYNLQGKEVANLVGHTGEVLSIALDGDRLVSGSSDQTIRVWDLSALGNGALASSNGKVKTLLPTLNLFISKNNEYIAWTPQGFYTASKGAEKYIGYHINHGAEHEAEFLDVGRFRKYYNRPDLVAKAIDGEDISSYASGINIDSILSAGLPPRVAILSDSTSINGDSTEIGVKVCDEGGGVENLNFYVDGKAIKYLSRTKAFRVKKESNGACMVIEQRISVPSGTHTISFDATNQKGDILSNKPSISIVNHKKVERKPNLHLLTLSINDYKDDSLDLKFPNNDADKLSQKLKMIGKSVFGMVNTYALKDSQVSKEQIEAKVKEIAQKVDANDVFVLYISGHGITNDADGDYYFIPYACANGADVTTEAINQKIFKQIMSQIKAVKSVILLDTCQSGSMASKELLSTSVSRFGGNVGSAIIAGASSQQNAIDGYKQHGIFTYTLLDAMSNKKVYDFEDKISIGDIAQYVSKILPRLAKKEFGHEQKPTIYMNGDTTFSIGGL